MQRQRSSKQLVSPAVDFRRIWSDRDSRGATREGISIWRPNPPPGYCSLGDDHFCPVSIGWLANGWQDYEFLPEALVPKVGLRTRQVSEAGLLGLQVTASHVASTLRETQQWCGMSTPR
jgi:hypothetical protein